MAQDSFIHNTNPAFINNPGGENLTFFRNSAIARAAADPSAPFQVKHSDGYLEPVTGGTGGGVLILGDIDVSTPQLYPAATEGDAYRIIITNPALETGLIGGAAGIQVERFDIIYAVATNLGGTQAAVGTSWTIWEGERFQLWVHGDPSVQGAILQNNIGAPNTSLSAFTVVMGSGNDIGATSDNSVAMGLGNTIGTSLNSLVGGNGNLISGGENNIAFGETNQINASEGSSSNNIVTGSGNILTDTSENNVSGATNSILGGGSNIVSGQLNGLTENTLACIVSGTSNQVNTNSQQCLVNGSLNIVQGSLYSFVSGSANLMNAQFSVAFGNTGRCDQNIKLIHSAGPVPVVAGTPTGSSQGEDLPGFVQTVGAVGGNLLSFDLPSDTALQITGNIVVSRHIAGGGAIGDSSGVFFTALVKNVAGAMTLVNSTGAAMVGEIVGATVTFGVAGASFTITANGLITDTLNWSVYARSARVAFNNYV